LISLHTYFNTIQTFFLTLFSSFENYDFFSYCSLWLVLIILLQFCYQLFEPWGPSVPFLIQKTQNKPFYLESWCEWFLRFVCSSFIKKFELNEMVVELCSENCGVSSMSPRISFSHDFSQSDVIPVEKHPLRSNSSGLSSSIDFNFCVQESLELESSSADELFSHGVILPTQIKKKSLNHVLLKQKSQQLAPPSQPPLPPSKSVCDNAPSTTRKSLKKESHKDSKDLNEEADEKHSSKSFWRFKRSSSCGSGYGRSLCPLPLLSRSNSTGSSPSVKRIPLSKEGHQVKQNSQKRSSPISRSHSQSLASHNNHQKPPLKRSHGSYANGIRVSPVLNVPSANLFGFGSIFSNNRDKSKKK